MNALLRTALTVAGLLAAGHAAAQVTFYEREDFEGRSFTTDRRVADFEQHGFNDRASSVEVLSERWEACEHAQYGGQCVVLRRGNYPSLAAMGLNNRVSSVRTVRRDVRIDERRYAPPPMASDDDSPQVTFYEREDFRGRSFTTERRVFDFERHGFNDRASSVVVERNRWEVCEDARFDGRCVVLRPGKYASLAAMGLDNRVSSVRNLSRSDRIDEHRYAPAPVADRDYRRGRDERLFEAEVISVRAVVGPPDRRCWVEREQVDADRGNANVAGAIAGAVIGGILGHQVGDGRGQDIATAIGAVGGAAVGANIGRNDGDERDSTRDVRRCSEQVDRSRPEYWDVTYIFRGQEHRIQTSAPPGPSITVNEKGEPRA